MSARENPYNRPEDVVVVVAGPSVVFELHQEPWGFWETGEGDEDALAAGDSCPSGNRVILFSIVILLLVV